MKDLPLKASGDFDEKTDSDLPRKTESLSNGNSDSCVRPGSFDQAHQDPWASAPKRLLDGSGDRATIAPQSPQWVAAQSGLERPRCPRRTPTATRREALRHVETSLTERRRSRTDRAAAQQLCLRSALQRSVPSPPLASSRPGPRDGNTSRVVRPRSASRVSCDSGYLTERATPWDCPPASDHQVTELPLRCGVRVLETGCPSAGRSRGRERQVPRLFRADHGGSRSGGGANRALAPLRR
jgi:hypothetical protein